MRDSTYIKILASIRNSPVVQLPDMQVDSLRDGHGKPFDFKPETKGKWIMEQPVTITSDDSVEVHVPHIVSHKWELDSTAEALTEADIWEVTLTLATVDGGRHVVTDLDELQKFARVLEGGREYASHKRWTFPYYVKNAIAHRNMVVEASKDD